jgi:hypothetical protein
VFEVLQLAPEVGVNEDRAVQVELWAAHPKHPRVSVCVVDAFAVRIEADPIAGLDVLPPRCIRSKGIDVLFANELLDAVFGGFLGDGLDGCKPVVWLLFGFYRRRGPLRCWCEGLVLASARGAHSTFAACLSSVVFGPMMNLYPRGPGMPQEARRG